MTRSTSMTKVSSNPRKFGRNITTVAKAASFTEAQARQFFESDLVEGFQDMSSADIQLALEDRGWVRMGQTLDGDAPWNVRRLTILRSRMYWLMDSHAASSVRVWTDYTLGSGMGFKADNDADQTLLSEFWNNRINRNVCSAEGQRRINRRLLVDGEIFFAIFDTEQGIAIRKIDCTQITQFITNPEDSEEVWGYRRTFGTPDGKVTTIYYRDWAYPNAPINTINTQDEGGMAGPIVPEESVVIYHLPFNAIHQRGNSLFSAALPWMQALRSFMEDRLAITQGLAKFIRKMTVKGGAAQVTKVKMAVEQAAGMTPGPIGDAAMRRARETAQTLFTNDAVNMSDVPRTTGASDSRQDFRNIRLMICGGVGMTEPYFGDAEAGNLASVTAMELPMLKQFESHQQLWADAWRDIFSIVRNFEDPQAVEVAIDWPPIVKENVQTFINAVVSACAEFPELVQPEVLTLVLNTIGVSNVDQVMVEVLKKQKELAATALNMAKGLGPDGSVLPQAVVGPDKPGQQLTGKPRAAVSQGSTESQEAYTTRLAATLTAIYEAYNGPTDL
jgi:hypothetical protein